MVEARERVDVLERGEPRVARRRQPLPRQVLEQVDEVAVALEQLARPRAPLVRLEVRRREAEPRRAQLHGEGDAALGVKHPRRVRDATLGVRQPLRRHVTHRHLLHVGTDAAPREDEEADLTHRVATRVNLSVLTPQRLAQLPTHPVVHVAAGLVELLEPNGV